MFEFIFSTEGFMPHGVCYLWEPGLVWLHAISDTLIAIAYFFIPITLIYFVLKVREVPFLWIFLAFGLFIIACGTTHLIAVWTLWVPAYWLSGTIKAFTALVSIVTAVALIPVIPKALSLPIELEATKKELLKKERLAVLGRLTATVNHELRNPLGTVLSSLFSIKEHVKGKDSGVDKALNRAERNIHRCNDIIEELLNYTRASDLNLTSTNLDRWLGKILDEKIIPGTITLQRNLTSGIEIKLDKERLRRAVINIIQNACEAMAEDNGGSEINGVLSDKNHLTVETRVSRDRVEIRFIDTGTGISQEEMKQIFEPLHTTKKLGVGMGLPIVKQIMEQHNGGVEINSEQGKGTEVILWMPV